MARIFVADDNPHVHRIVEEVLGSEGHEILGVEDGVCALEQVAEAVPDLVLLDTTLPGVGVYDICHGIQEQRGLDAVRIVMLAGPLESIDPDEATQAGVHAVLQKPLDAKMLSALVAADTDSAPPKSEAEQNLQMVDTLVHQALGQESAEPSREAIREQIEAVVMASMPTIIDRIADRLAERLRNP